MAETKEQKAPNYNALKQMWEYLTEKYEFKRDIIKSRILWRERDSDNKAFNILDDEKLNTMSIDLGFQGYKSCSPSNITLFLYSEFTPVYDPVVEYLKDCAKRKPTKAIDALAETVVTTQPELWKKYLRKWLVASVANVMQKVGCQNHMCLTLTGGQGKGKTTWLTYLCPSDLADYIYTGELDLGKKADTVWKLAEYWFVNIEEQIKSLNRADSNTMKSLITLPDIKGRRPYGRLEAQGRRIANFMASTNDDDFLMDATGSRRYLCFKVLDIKPDYKKVKINEVWAEAYNLYTSGDFRYWMDDKDIEELQQNNKEFAYRSQEYEYVAQFFSTPCDKHKPTHLAPATVIRDYLRFETQNNNLKEKYIGLSMKDLGFEQISARVNGSPFPVKVWKVRLNTGTTYQPFNKYQVTNN